MAVQFNIICKSILVGCYIVPVKSDAWSLKWILLLLCISDIWCVCPWGLLKNAYPLTRYLLTSLPSCLLLISYLPAWSQITTIIGSTSIRHASDRCLIDADWRPLLSWVLCWHVLWWPEWRSPTSGYLHVRCLKWWRPHEVISFPYRLLTLIDGVSWWRHQMETFSALLAICAGNSPVTGVFPAQQPVTQSFGVFFDLRLNKRLSK